MGKDFEFYLLGKEMKSVSKKYISVRITFPGLLGRKKTI